MACMFCNLQMPCCYECSNKECEIRCSGRIGNASKDKKCIWYSAYKARNKCDSVK